MELKFGAGEGNRTLVTNVDHASLPTVRGKPEGRRARRVRGDPTRFNSLLPKNFIEVLQV